MVFQLAARSGGGEHQCPRPSMAGVTGAAVPSAPGPRGPDERRISNRDATTLKSPSKQSPPLRQLWADNARASVSRLFTRRNPPSPPSVLPLLLLLFALSTVFLFGNDRSHFYRGSHHNHLSSHGMALAANLSPSHHFLMFIRRIPGTNNTYGYEPYNRFPIGTYALIKLHIIPFANSLAKQIYAARILMLSCFAATAVLAYYCLCRLISNQWVALTATLLSFSSTYCLYYNDMISTEATTSLFGVLLSFHGMVVFLQERHFRQLAAKICIALLLGWHVYSLLLPFVFGGFIGELISKKNSNRNIHRIVRGIIVGRHPLLMFVALHISLSIIIFHVGNEIFLGTGGNSLEYFLRISSLLLPFLVCGFILKEVIKKRLRESTSVLFSSRYLLLGVIALFFGTCMLSLNIINEYFALEGEASLKELPTFRSMLWRTGLASPEDYADLENRLDWLPYLRGQLSRIGVASVPFSVPGYTSVFDVGYGRASNGLLSVLVGSGVLGASLVGLIAFRYRILVATLISAGIVWALAMRHQVYVHDFEALFYIGIPLIGFSLVLLCIRRLANDYLLVGLAAAALLTFTLSSFHMGRIGHGPEATKFHELLHADFEAIRRITGDDTRVLVLASGRDTPFPWGRHAADYYLTGSIIGYERDGYELADYDFVITSKREVGGSLLTPENRYVFLYGITRRLDAPQPSSDRLNARVPPA